MGSRLAMVQVDVFTSKALEGNSLAVFLDGRGLSDEQMLYLGFPLGFAASGIFSGMGAYLTELFPSRIRANGQGFAYNFGRGIGAFFPVLVGYLSETHGLATAIGLFAGGAYLVVIIITLLLPETRGKVLA